MSALEAILAEEFEPANAPPSAIHFDGDYTLNLLSHTADYFAYHSQIRRRDRAILPHQDKYEMYITAVQRPLIPFISLGRMNEHVPFAGKGKGAYCYCALTVVTVPRDHSISAHIERGMPTEFRLHIQALYERFHACWEYTLGVLTSKTRIKREIHLHHDAVHTEELLFPIFDVIPVDSNGHWTACFIDRNKRQLEDFVASYAMAFSFGMLHGI